MAAVGKAVAIGLLIFTATTKGFAGVQMNSVENVTASVGQYVILPCRVNGNNVKVTQIEWKKLEEKSEKKLLVYIPNMKKEFRHTANVSLMVNNIHGTPEGFHLLLPTVGLQDSGRYVCDLATFPDGSVKLEAHLRVTDLPAPTSPPELQLSARVMGKDQGVREGDHVKVLCTSSPRADIYALWPSKNSTNTQLREDGVFEFSNVTRDDNDLYVCQPRWNSPSHAFADRNTTVMLTVLYLDALECNTSSLVEVNPGQNLAVSCQAEASGPVSFTWVKDNVTVSDSNSVLLHHVTSEDAGMYTVTVTMVGQPTLQRHAVVRVTVRPVLASTSSNLLDPTSLITATRESVQTSTSSSLPADIGWTDTIATTSQPGWHSVAETISSENMTTEQMVGITSASDDHTSASTADESISGSVLPWMLPNVTSQGKHVLSVFITCISQHSPVTNVTANPERAKRYVLWTIFPFLALAVIVAVLFMRYRKRTKMDLPPPFKPPPPPVKYTSVWVGGYSPISSYPMTNI